MPSGRGCCCCCRWGRRPRARTRRPMAHAAAHAARTHRPATAGRTHFRAAARGPRASAPAPLPGLKEPSRRKPKALRPVLPENNERGDALTACAGKWLQSSLQKRLRAEPPCFPRDFRQQRRQPELARAQSGRGSGGPGAGLRGAGAADPPPAPPSAPGAQAGDWSKAPKRRPGRLRTAVGLRIANRASAVGACLR